MSTKTYSEVNEAWAKMYEMEPFLGASNVDNILNTALEMGIDTLSVKPQEMSCIVAFALANNRNMPWEELRDNWCKKLLGVTFIKNATE